MVKQYNYFRIKNSTTKLDYFLFFILIQLSWVSIFTNIPRLEFITFFLIFIISIKQYKKVVLENRIIFIFMIYSLLAVIQGFIWSFSLLSLITSFILSFLLPYYFFIVYKDRFLLILEKVIYALTVISLTIWFAHQIIPGAKELIEYIIELFNRNIDTEHNLVRGMLIYTYWPGLDLDFGLSRNSGFTYEPATYVGFILLGVFINYTRNKDIFHKRNLLYFVAIISSFSTGGYLSFAVLCLLLLKQKRGRMLGLILLPIFIITFYTLVMKLDFMQSKIEQQYTEQTETTLTTETSGRFLGARKAIVVLTNHPLYGRGLLAVSKPELTSDPESAQYGWLTQVSRFGIIFGTLLMYYIYKGIYLFNRSGGNDLYCFLIFGTSLFINLSAQSLITSPFYMIFFYYGLFNFKSFNMKTGDKYNFVKYGSLNAK